MELIKPYVEVRVISLHVVSGEDEPSAAINRITFSSLGMATIRLRP